MTRISFQDDEEGTTSLFPSLGGTDCAVVIWESTFSNFADLVVDNKKKIVKHMSPCLLKTGVNPEQCHNRS